jgi:glucosamine 6-phosphate synthetase-like amidotransferase/phosphosugar isomerase protein
MCGILGFIGKSKNALLSQKLVTCLFQKTQVRGSDASGFYCASDFDRKEVFFHKLPEPSTVYVENIAYQKLWENDLNLGIFHCRAATQGVGLPAENKNNHPFVSENLQKAVIHNGFINKSEYKILKSLFETNTDCDSEIVLRILEQNPNFEDSLSEFFGLTEKSAYAVAFAEVDEHVRSLTLFRNIHRPIMIVDLRDLLGQIFFCSTLEILLQAVHSVPELSDAAIGISQLDKDTVLNIRFDIANTMSVSSFDLKHVGQIGRRSNGVSKIKNTPKLFSAPINFDWIVENTANKDDIMKKLEQIILIYNRKQNFSDGGKSTSAINHHAKMLQDLLQKEVP